MPLLKSKSKKAMSENIKTEMDAGKPQKQSVAIAYDIMRRAKKKKMAQGGLTDPGTKKDNMEASIDTYSPYRDKRNGPNPEGFSSSQPDGNYEDRIRNGSNTEEDDKSLQERMVSRPSDKENRSNVLFDGKAERRDPLQDVYREDQTSIHMGRQDYGEADADADDIVSRIMRRMRRK